MAADSESQITANKDLVKKIPADIAQEILRAVASIEYGSIEVVVHESKVVQIECREKIRVSQRRSCRKTLES
ncbi:MAG: YezD family protein [Nitrosomonas sp.]|uniref:YezD family protein n=1 Tax=Nitrosomonas sp. TaxID=42353 RepID=UPI0027309687|nr:YezD family protein [Nitrosomonas sp.]MDP1550528.1 YezD family protein [Nitrosomonas sp.]MDP1934520.1 YezD family protein [Nitrosomonas sp.]MDP3280044.1 YezD family protein [Nitrosomonas sp.]MDP3664374.1 YezD family protein [Nitrosomonas sp.]MDZ4107686.1 YezD family protein [Nitrosomonas sp.]